MKGDTATARGDRGQHGDTGTSWLFSRENAPKKSSTTRIASRDSRSAPRSWVLSDPGVTRGRSASPGARPGQLPAVTVPRDTGGTSSSSDQEPGAATSVALCRDLESQVGTRAALLCQPHPKARHPQHSGGHGAVTRRDRTRVCSHQAAWLEGPRDPQGARDEGRSYKQSENPTPQVMEHVHESECLLLGSLQELSKIHLL